MPKELPSIKLLPGQTILITGPAPMMANVDKKTKTRARVTAPGTYVEPTPVPVTVTSVFSAAAVIDRPTPPSTGTKVFGPGVASDGKDNRPVGRSDDSHYAARWHSRGGDITSVAFNQRFGPPNAANPGLGYSNGTGGKQRISLVPVLSGLPDMTRIVAQREFMPTNPGTNAEDRRPIQFLAVIPAGDYCLVWDNIDPDPTHNWMSINCLFNPMAKAQPGTDSVVLERTNATSDKWRVVSNNTPTFQVTFADGHTEGQGYGSIIANTDLDGDGPSGFALTGVRKVRQRLLTSSSLSVTAAWLRVKHLSSSGLLYATINGVTGSGDVSGIPITSKADLNGGVWVRCPLTTTVPIGNFTVDFRTSATLDVMPIRKDGFEQDGWKIPNNGGWAEKSLNGSTWADLYNKGCDLQMYLELA